MENNKHVLDVGQCDPDHGAIRRMLEGQFGAEVTRTHGMDDTLAELKSGKFSLVLINRKLDADYSDGIEILKRIKQDQAFGATPVMLVTNYPEHQQASVDAGGVQGFGKAEINRPETIDRVRQYLG